MLFCLHARSYAVVGQMTQKRARKQPSIFALAARGIELPPLRGKVLHLVFLLVTRSHMQFV